MAYISIRGSSQLKDWSPCKRDLSMGINHAKMRSKGLETYLRSEHLARCDPN